MNLPEGPYSALATYAKLCEQKLLMPTTIVGQNGVAVRQGTRITVRGCPKVKLISAKVKGATASLTLQIPAAGRLGVSGSGLKHTVRMLKHAGRTTVEADPNSAGVAAFHGRHRLKVTLRASLTPSNGPGSSVSTTVTFR